MIERLKNEAGFALILTLVVTALMVAVVVEMIHQVYVDTSISRGFRDGQQASILAESGVIMVKTALSKGVDPAFLSSFLAKPLSDEIGSLEIKISDENGKIYINALVGKDGKTVDDTFTRPALKRLVKNFKLPEQTWDAVIDWMDTDNNPYSSLGAEESYYRTLIPPYTPRNDKLATLTELTLVKGIKPEIVGSLRPYLTLYYDSNTSQLPPISINSAPKEVLMALDSNIDERMAERIMEQRSIKAFDSIADVNNRVPGTNAGLGAGANILYKGNIFRVTAVAKVKESARTVEVVISTNTVLSWQEY